MEKYLCQYYRITKDSCEHFKNNELLIYGYCKSKNYCAYKKLITTDEI